MKENIKRIREMDTSGYPDTEITKEYKRAPLITVGEECTQPQECRKCLEICAPKVFVLCPDLRAVPSTYKYPLMKVGWEDRRPEAMQVIAAEPTLCTQCMACVRVCPHNCITIEMPAIGGD